MGEQAAELRSILSVLRRRWGVLAGAAVLGAVAGVIFVVLRPPMYTSTSQVLLAPQTDASGQTIEPDMNTQIRVASSEAVLGPVASGLDSPISVTELEQRVTVSAPASYVVQFKASAETADAAEELANDLAESQVNYLDSASSSQTNAEQSALAARERSLERSLEPVNAEIKRTKDRIEEAAATGADTTADESALAQLTAEQADLVLKLDEVKKQMLGGDVGSGASIIQRSSPAGRPNRPIWYGAAALVGAVGALLIASVIVVGLSRRDRRLWYRDDLADALGKPVIASVRSQAQKDVAGWTALLVNYAPDKVDAWALRRTLRELAFDDTEHGATSTPTDDGRPPHPTSITVFSLADDPRGTALGPQLAGYAATTGIRTHLVVAEEHESVSALWAACRSHDGEVWPNLTVNAPSSSTTCDLMIVLAVVDPDTSEVSNLPDTRASVLAVSSGAATAEDIARIAVSADDAGSPIDGIIVADPDNLDRTSGRFVQSERASRAPSPSRLTGVPSVRSGDTNVFDMRRGTR
ncbi:MAG: Wzz/FepE/Etk N-terminal domain-containing protein [Actinomycetia bacterium]|nr:Wzz/FepE/Etk N-terminal domain-containing protein [Actinomycetes bacterium]